jgi:hypothetical protein
VHGQTRRRSARRTCALSCIALLLTGNVGAPGTGANIFRGHTNVQGATDLGLDISNLPLYYGPPKAPGSTGPRLGRRVRVAAGPVRRGSAKAGRKPRTRKENMETPGITSTRWFDAVNLPEDQIDQRSLIRGMVVFGHGGNTGDPRAGSRKGLEKLDLLVVADPHPTSYAQMSERKNNTYLLPICTNFETDGSRTASNRSLQWGEQVVKPIFESRDDYDVLYRLANKLGFADRMFKNIKVVNGRPEPEDVLREINRGGWSTGYTGQSPERLKAHMRNQGKFDLVTLRAPKDDPEVGGDYYGLPWPCWGKPELRHPGSAILYNTNLHVKDGGGTFRARFGLERNGETLLADGSYSAGSELTDGYPEFTMGVLKKLGWDKDLSPGRAFDHRPDRRRPGGFRVLGDGPVRRHPARLPRPRRHALRQRQGSRPRLEPARPGADPPRADLHAAAGPRREVPDAAGRPPVPDAEHRLLGPEGGGGQGDRQGLPDHPDLRPPRRVRGRRRGDPLQPLAGGAPAGHVREINTGDAAGPRHQGRPVGLGVRRREQGAHAREGPRDRPGRARRRLHALPLRRMVPGPGHAGEVSEGRTRWCSARASTRSPPTASTR